MSKVSFRARFFGVIWIKISDSRMWRMVLQKTWVAQKFSSNFTDLAVSFFCGNVRLGISFSSREVAHRLSKLRKSQSSEFCFFRNDV